MERKIGEIFEYDDEWYQCIRSTTCAGCSLFDTICMGDDKDKVFGECSYAERNDGKSISFKKLEKIREPFEINGYTYQEYAVYTYPALINGDAKIPTVNGFAVIIKENKGDMKIKRVIMNHNDRDYLLDTLEAILHDTHCQEYKDEICEAFSKYIIPEATADLKPFDLDAAKAGKPVCTRDGRKARIICFDRGDNKPIVALITTNNREYLTEYYCNGRISHYNSENNDLMMRSENKEGWVNVYCDCDGANITKDDNIYSSKDAAIASAQIIDRDNYVATAKINWEE